MTSFDVFAPVGVGATDPYFPGLDTASAPLGLTYMTTDTSTNGRVGSGTVGDMLMPPLSGDDFLLQNMQALSGSNTGFDVYSNSE
jgi:hypothetical protein